MRMALLALAATALAGGAAHAQDNPNAGKAPDAAGPQAAPAAAKMLYVCDADELSWRAFSRDLGTPEFVTAEQVRADNGKPWAAPKCITEAELRRLTSTRLGQLTLRDTRGR